MAFFSKRPKTSTQKAQKAQLGILARLIGCAYLIYIVVQLLRTAPEDDKISPTLKIVISVFFLCAAAVVIIITVLEFIRNLKSGFYKSTAHTDDIIEAYASQEAEKFPLEPASEQDTDPPGGDSDSETTDESEDEPEDEPEPAPENETEDESGDEPEPTAEDSAGGSDGDDAEHSGGEETDKSQQSE